MSRRYDPLYVVAIAGVALGFYVLVQSSDWIGAGLGFTTILLSTVVANFRFDGRR